VVLEEEQEEEPGEDEEYDEQTGHKRPSSVAVCGVGDTFGVAALVMLGSQTRQYSMWTSERSLFVVISREKLVPFLETHANLEASLKQASKLFLVQRFAAPRDSIFHSLTSTEIEEFAKRADFLKLAPGTVVYSAGDMSSAFYVIAFGECVREYTAEGPDVPPLALPVGAYFGEVGLLLPNTPMIATVKATDYEKVTLIKISREDFDAVIGSNKLMQLELAIKMQRREAIQLELMLLHPRTHPVWVDFAIKHLRGGLRITVHNAAATLLYKSRVAAA